MFAALLGILLGVAVSAGPLAIYRSDAHLLSERMIQAADSVSQGIIRRLPYASDNPKLVTVLSVALAVATPGMVALILVVAANAATGIRRASSGVLVLAALASFLVLPAVSASILLAFAIGVSVFLIAPGVLLAKVALWGVATVIAFDHVHALWSGTAPSIVQGAETLRVLTGFSTSDFWHFALMAVGISPFPIAASVALKS